MLSKKRKPPRVIIPHPNFLRAMKGFVPIFLNDHDQWLIRQIEKHNKRLKEVDNEALRLGKNLTAKMQEILKEEVKLIEMINSRNMDF